MDFDKKYHDMTIPTGGMIKLNIDLEGQPLPTVTWYRDGVTLKGEIHFTAGKINFVPLPLSQTKAETKVYTIVY